MASAGISRRGFLKQAGAAAGMAGMFQVLPGCASGARGGQWTVFVTIDTQRADHCSAWGYKRKTTPFLDALAAEGARFERCYAHCGSTYPSHTTAFTGLEILQHGVVANRSDPPAPQIRTVSEMFKEADYHTGAFTSIYVLANLNKGFDAFNDDVPEARMEFDKAHRYRFGADTIDAAMGWLDQWSPSDRVFLWVHVFDPHEWMAEGEPQNDVAAMQIAGKDQADELFRYWTEDLKKQVDIGRLPLNGSRGQFMRKQNNYDARTWYVDNELRRLYEYTAAKGPAGRVLWMVTSDHGEGLGNHGYDQHAQYLYNEQLHIPLVMHQPNVIRPGLVIPEPVSHTDFYPTFAEILEEPITRQAFEVQGQSLWPAVTGKARVPERDIYAHRQIRHPEYKTAQSWRPDHHFGLHNGKYKYLHYDGGDPEFYDLEADPFELNNLAPQEPEEMGRMQAEALARRDQFAKEGLAPDVQSTTTPEQEALMESLGYL